MKRQDKIAITAGALLASAILLVFFPIYVHGPTKISNHKLYSYKHLSDMIQEFKKSEGRLPKSFQEIDSGANGFISMLIDDYDTDGMITVVEPDKVVFEIEAAWESNKSDELLWGKTKNGDIVRFPRRLLKETR